MIDTPIRHKGEKSGPVCVPYALGNEVRVQASLACINSLCQEVAFDPNTQNLAQNMADTKCIHVGEGCAPPAGWESLFTCSGGGWKRRVELKNMHLRLIMYGCVAFRGHPPKTHKLSDLASNDKHAGPTTCCAKKKKKKLFL